MLDVVLSNRPTRPCTTTRRDLLRAGALGLTTLTLPAPSKAEPAAPKPSARAKSAILVFLGGGLSHIDSFDPKPDAPADVRGRYAAIDTAVPGLRVCEKLPLLARVMDRVSLVRSAGHASDHHETATNWVLSGRSGSAFGDHPAAGAVVAHELGRRGALPAHVAIPRNPAFTWELGKSAFLGGRCESFKAGDPGRAEYRAAGGAFAIDREPDSLRDRYGRGTAGQSMLLARRLVEAGTRFVTVSHAGWDHHANLHDALDQKLPEFDRALSALVEDMDARGTLDETLLVVASEFGRTPRLNRAAGRDHWPHAASVLFAGAGVKRGFVLGATDRHGAYPSERPVSPADVVHTVLDSLGVDPRRHLHLPDGRPVAILDGGRTLKELFA